MWKMDIDEQLTIDKRVKAKCLESMIGLLNHIGYVILHARYFLNRLRYLLQRCQRYGPQLAYASCRLNLLLWKIFLANAAKDILINLTTFTQWDDVIFTDACEHDLGGFNPRTGRACRFALPPWATYLHINTVEFLTALIDIWVELSANNTRYLRLMCLTDNSSALTWLHEENFDPKKGKIKEAV